MKTITNLFICFFVLALLANSVAATSSENVINFLKNDQTEKQVLSNTYTSKDFANTLIRNASDAGIEAHKFKVYFHCRAPLFLVAFEDGTAVNPCGTREGTGIDKIVDGPVNVDEKINIHTLTECKRSYDLPKVKDVNWLNVPEDWQIRRGD
jgi:hypothetical protein